MVTVHCCDDSSMCGEMLGNSTSMFAQRVHADVSAAHLLPAGVFGAKQEVSAGVAVTFDPELRAEGRVEPVAADIHVAAAADAAAGMLALTSVATVTPAEMFVAAGDCRFVPLPPLCSQTGDGGACRKCLRRVCAAAPAGGGWRRLWAGGAAGTRG